MLTVRKGHGSKTIYVDCQDTHTTFGGHGRCFDGAAVSVDAQWIASIIAKVVMRTNEVVEVGEHTSRLHWLPLRCL
jgi:hypothetical protein